MSQVKKILISLPNALLKEVDEFVGATEFSRSEFIREAMRQYIRGHRILSLRENMKSAYREMGDINLSISNQSVDADNLQQFVYEKKLSEREV